MLSEISLQDTSGLNAESGFPFAARGPPSSTAEVAAGQATLWGVASFWVSAYFSHLRMLLLTRRGSVGKTGPGAAGYSRTGVLVPLALGWLGDFPQLPSLSASVASFIMCPRGQVSTSPFVHFMEHVKTEMVPHTQRLMLLMVTSLRSLAAPGTEGLPGSTWQPLPQPTTGTLGQTTRKPHQL